MAEPISYMPDGRFAKRAPMAEIMAREINIAPGDSLDADGEQTVFLQLNYARYRLQVRRKLLRQGRWPLQDVQALLEWHRRQLQARSAIVTANMGLVLAMVRRVNYAGVEFTDLISEGSMALLRATEKFDVSRGWKFSTYACRAILKAFSRAAKKSYRYRSLFPTQLDPALERSDLFEQKREDAHQEWAEEVKMIVNDNFRICRRLSNRWWRCVFPSIRQTRSP